MLGDFNIGIDNSSMGHFYDTFDLKSLATEPKCYKNPEVQLALAFF